MSVLMSDTLKPLQHLIFTINLLLTIHHVYQNSRHALDLKIFVNPLKATNDRKGMIRKRVEMYITIHVRGKYVNIL